MNLCCIEINDGQIGDNIEIVGLDGKNNMYNLASQSDRLIYEILVDLDKNIRRESV